VTQPPGPFGQYWLLEMLSQGGSGAVYLATVPGTESLVVIKRLRSELVGKKMLALRLQHEAAIAVSVDSPHVVEVFDVGAVNGEPYLAMAYVAGWPVLRLLKEVSAGAPLSVALVSALLADGLRGLAALHGATHPVTGEALGIVHRDISPRNLILGRDHRLVIIDLGIGRSNIQEWATRTGTLLGTPGYMAPEQILGRRVDHRTDLYALSVVAFELLTGTPYIERGDRQQMIERCVSSPFRAPSTLRSDVPVALDRFLERCLSVQAEDRFSSALEALEALGPVAPLDPAALPSSFASEVEGELERLSALARRIGEPGEDQAPTIVYARRSGSRFTATLPEPTQTLPEPRSKSRALAYLLGTAAATALVAAITARVVEKKDPIELPIDRPVPTELPPTVEIRAREIAEEPAPVRSERKPRLQRRTPEVDETRPVAPPEPPSFDRLIREASELRKRRPDLEAALEEIIADGLLWKRAEASPARDAALADLRRRLDQLE
jgi:eukaryotic-like serine/threonine-protein kinase